MQPQLRRRRHSVARSASLLEAPNERKYAGDIRLRFGIGRHAVPAIHCGRSCIVCGDGSLQASGIKDTVKGHLQEGYGNLKEKESRIERDLDDVDDGRV